MSPVANVAVISALPLLGIVLLFFIGIAHVTSVFTDYDDALGISQEMGEETGNYSHSASKEQKEYYERINK